MGNREPQKSVYWNLMRMSIETSQEFGPQMKNVRMRQRIRTRNGATGAAYS